jgi:hypothetical protein
MLRPSQTCFLVSGLCFFAAALAAVVSFLGPPMIFAFSTSCSVFLFWGALEYKKESLVEKGRKDFHRFRQDS